MERKSTKDKSPLIFLFLGGGSTLLFFNRTRLFSSHCPTMPAPLKDAKGKDKGADGTKKKKVAPVELCLCGVDTYRPPPKGKKAQAPILHNPGCFAQRTTCEAYPHLPPCTVCQNPCKFCLGKTRWCPHCYEHQCLYRYKRLVMGKESLTGSQVGPGTAANTVIPPRGSRRTTAVTFSDKQRKSSRRGRSFASRPASGTTA